MTQITTSKTDYFKWRRANGLGDTVEAAAKAGFYAGLEAAFSEDPAYYGLYASAQAFVEGFAEGQAFKEKVDESASETFTFEVTK